MERYEQERTWILLGLSIRVATDLNLHRKVEWMEEDGFDGEGGGEGGMDVKMHNAEIRNRERTWL